MDNRSESDEPRSDEGSENSDERSIPVTWVGIDELAAVSANQFVSQFTKDLFLVTFGQLSPPVLLGTSSEKEERLSELDFVAIRPVTRVALTHTGMRELVQVLQTNLQRYEDSIQAAEEKNT